MKSLFNEFIIDTSSLLRGAYASILKQKILFFLLFPLLGLAGSFVLFQYDLDLSSKYIGAKQRDRQTYDLMKKISKTGGFGGVASACALLVVAGKIFGKRRIFIAGLAGFLASSTAGLLNNGIKLSGRPRPDAKIEYKLEDKFYGPKLNSRHLPDSHYLSFPSGHSATAFGAASTIAFILPVLAIPAFATALIVGYSRIYLLDHYASDVFVGALIGILFGLAFYLSAKMILKQK